MSVLRPLKLWMLPLLASAAVTPAALGQGAPASASLGPLYACADAGADAARLACFEREAARLKAAEGAGEMAVISRRQVAEAETRAFGLNTSSASELAAAAGVKPPPKAGEDKDQPMVFAVKAIREGPDGKLRFEMENGQVWKQTDSAALPKLGKGPWTARIRRAAIGSFFLNLDDRRAIRAERVS